PPRRAPGQDEPDNADDRAEQAARLERLERQQLAEHGRGEIEAAAVVVEVDEGEGAKIGEARRVIRIEHLAILRLRVVVPAEAVVLEGEERHDGERREHGKRNGIGSVKVRARGGWQTHGWQTGRATRNEGGLASLERSSFVCTLLAKLC